MLHSDLIIWGIVFAVMVIAELLTFQLVSIWFAAGAAASFVTALFGIDFWIQLIAFAAVSVILLIATRPILKKFRINKTEPTNTELDIGKTAVVKEDIDNSRDRGRATLDGVDWKAVSADDTFIPKGSIVKVNDIKGSKLFVELIEEKINS